jgi:hypothetical protein
VSCDSICICQGARQCEQASEIGANLPRQLDGLRLSPIGPEKVEEEGAAEDGRDVYTDEDVVRGDTDEVVVVDCDAGVKFRDELLLVDVVYSIVSWCCEDLQVFVCLNRPLCFGRC